MSSETRSLEEILAEIKPKVVSIGVEMPQENVGSEPTSSKGIDHATRTIWIVELVRATLDKVEVTSVGVFKTPTTKGHAQIVPNYTFVGISNTVKHLEAEFAFIYTLDEKYIIVHAPEESGILPYTKLDN